jgi:hypothetical protein
MELTRAYERYMPAEVLKRYDFAETRNAAAVLTASNPNEFAEVVQVLLEFKLLKTDFTKAGGNKSALAARLDERFRELGWREGQHVLNIESTVRLMPYRKAKEKAPLEKMYVSSSRGFKVDNLKGRIACDVEWNAKDGNLDRDVGAYRRFYDEEIIDGAVIITRTQDDLRALAAKLGGPARLDTTTTTNLDKLKERLARGSAGGCPVLAVAITARCLAG